MDVDSILSINVFMFWFVIKILLVFNWMAWYQYQSCDKEKYCPSLYGHIHVSTTRNHWYWPPYYSPVFCWEAQDRGIHVNAIWEKPSTYTCSDEVDIQTSIHQKPMVPAHPDDNGPLAGQCMLPHQEKLRNSPSNIIKRLWCPHDLL